MKSPARRLLIGVGWTYGSQLATVVTQVGYATITSRTVNAHAFGAYGVALTATGVFTLLTTGGLSQTVSRLHEVNRSEISAVFSYALVVGGVGGLATLALAQPLANAWGSPNSAGVIAVLSLNSFTAPLFGVTTGLLLRRGKFAQLALITFIANVVGMIFGVIAVLRWRSPESLVLSAVISQIAVVTATGWSVRADLSIVRFRRQTDAISFSQRLVLAQAMQYLIGNAARWSASNAIGTSVMGQWNRAEVLSTLPFQQLQSSVLSVVYPEFRHDRDDVHRSYDLWPDLLAMIAWFTLPLGFATSALLPSLIPLLFGSRWSQAGLLAIPLGLAGGIQPVAIMLSSSVEAIAKFKVVWIVNGVLLAIQAVLAFSVYVYAQIWIAIISLLVTNLLMHILYVAWAHRAGRINLSLLLINYRAVLVGACLVGGLSGLLSLVIAQRAGNLSSIIMTIVYAMLLIYLSWHNRRSLPPVRIARRLGLLAGG